MTKRPGEDTDQVKVKQRVAFRDDGGGQQESDVEMDTPPVQGPQGTDVQLGLSPPMGQVASDDDLAVPGKSQSKMVKDHRNPDDHAALDARIVSYQHSPVSLDPIGRKGVLLGTLMIIAQQNGYDAEVQPMFKTYDWLHDFLIDQWREESFTKARRLGECPLCLPCEQCHMICLSIQKSYNLHQSHLKKKTLRGPVPVDCSS